MKKYYSNTNPGLLAEWTTAGERPFLCIVPTRSRAETLQVNLDVLHAGEAELLPGWDITPGKTTFPEQNLQYRRLKALNRLQQTGLRGLVMPVNALGIPVLNPGNLPVLNLNSGQQIPPKQVIRKLETLGYSRQSLVQQQGDYALRGDLLDFYPDNHQFPLRISFFDREIETIEYFHPSTQMKADEQPELPLKLTLRSEFALAPEEREKLQDKLLASGFRDQANILEYSRQPEGLPGWFGLWPRKIVNPEDLLENPRIAVYKPEKCLEEIEEWEEELGNLNQKDPRQKTFRSIEKVLEDIDETRSPRYFFNFYQQTSLTPPGGEEKYGEPININPSASLEPRPIEDFIQIISELTEDCQIIRIHCSEESFRGRLRELLVEQLGSAENINNCELELIASPWRGSYRFGEEARVSLDDFFNRTISRGKIGGLSGKTEYLASFEELNPGDLVVHEDFGIGRFKGLKRVETEKQVRDCLLVEYEGQDRLYLPPDQAARIQKYLADSGFTPSLSSLDSGRWSRVKSRVKEDVNELAEELLELYMDREDSEAEPYPPDSLAQTQFEASFPYRETPDQQQSIKQVKEDLQKPRPMDRLICGDSGYGKTEVALRAAFKGADDGRQVAMLVPTTVLARQHYETFSNRFSFFEPRVEMLSRFQSPAKEKEIIKGLKNGQVDIVIGTHRLLSEDIEFNNLGLLIIDEEQRFGVQQKETLKFYRKNVDVLTLTATPIPRTLYMSLSGLQDISVINTPPEDRIPIKMEVGPFDREAATEALEKELARGGQVFWLYNRVKDIERRANYVQSLLPRAEVGIAHGQLPKSKLRRTMNKFYNGEIDILVCTTIIEAGLDCPNVNTMIIQEAHMFGLAQLYQLRGRIGRSHEQAYAHLYYPRQTNLTEDAEARLETIKQCSEMGSGFQLAMRDLEIRGAGNLLGKDQHGNIRAVGFPFYCRLLQRSIRRLREGFEVPEPFPRLKLPGEHYIPHKYIPDDKQIIQQYQSLASCRELEELKELGERWQETFGPLPEPVKNVLRRHAFKILAVNNSWEDIRYKNQRLNLKYSGQKPEKLVRAAKKLDLPRKFRGSRLFIRRFSRQKIEKWLHLVTDDLIFSG